MPPDRVGYRWMEQRKELCLCSMRWLAVCVRALDPQRLTWRGPWDRAEELPGRGAPGLPRGPLGQSHHKMSMLFHARNLGDPCVALGPQHVAGLADL